MRRIALALALVTLATAASAGAAHATDDPTSHPGPGRRAVCLDSTRTLYLTPDEENVPGTAPTPGPCPTPGSTTPTTSSEIVTLCIQGHTTTGHRGSTNPAGYPYFEGRCEGTTTSTTAPRGEGAGGGQGPPPVHGLTPVTRPRPRSRPRARGRRWLAQRTRAARPAAAAARRSSTVEQRGRPSARVILPASS